jgi:hypothetical protein
MRTLAVGVLIAVMLMLAPATAHARDEQGFLDAVAALGYTDHGQALSAGYAVCSLRGQIGQSLTERILRRLLEKAQQQRDADNSNEFSDAAVAFLCPRMF